MGSLEIGIIGGNSIKLNLCEKKVKIELEFNRVVAKTYFLPVHLNFPAPQ